MARTLIFLCLLSGAAPASACSIPVFRYALEQWPASKYELLIVHRGPLSMADQTLAARYREEAKLANVVVKDVDLNGTVDAKLKAIVLRDLGASALPKLLLRYPDTDEKVPSAWSGWMTPDSLSGLSFSPARDVLFERLTAGNAAVVLLLLSGDATADEAARTTLSRELPRIARRIDLPKQTEEGPQLTSELPLKVDFPVIEVHRNGREDTLVKLLLASEEGLTEVKGPIAFPVFGRGRALCSIHGKDLTQSAEIQRPLEFLCRACSCQVKELNPGIDLLMGRDWDVIFSAVRGPAPRESRADVTPWPSTISRSPAAISEPPAGPSPILGTTEMRTAPPPGFEAAELRASVPPSNGDREWRPYLLVAAGLMVLASGGWMIQSRRSNHRV